MSTQPLKIERMETKTTFVKNKSTGFNSKHLELVGPGKNPTFGDFEIVRLKNAKEVNLLSKKN